MSNYYQQRFYARKGNDSRFYIPLNYKVDVERLLLEVNTIINPQHSDYGITTSHHHVNDEVPDFKRYSGISTLDSNGVRKLKSGETDEEIVFWPKVLEDSYIKKLADDFSAMIGLKNPRVRMSKSILPRIPMHTDPHTPYRIHIALETDKDCMFWGFRESSGVEHLIHQPADGIPVLIETGITSHSVIGMPEAKTHRTHLWYQFHDIISDDILKNL